MFRIVNQNHQVSSKSNEGKNIREKNYSKIVERRHFKNIMDFECI